MIIDISHIETKVTCIEVAEHVSKPLIVPKSSIVPRRSVLI